MKIKESNNVVKKIYGNPDVKIFYKTKERWKT